MLLKPIAFKRLCLARDLLAEVWEQPLSTGEIAREIGISPFHFIRQFEAVFGVTPHQYRIKSRLEQAKLLLARGSYSVTDVCMEVGSLASVASRTCSRAALAPLLRLTDVPLALWSRSQVFSRRSFFQGVSAL